MSLEFGGVLYNGYPDTGYRILRAAKHTSVLKSSSEESGTPVPAFDQSSSVVNCINQSVKESIQISERIGPTARIMVGLDLNGPALCISRQLYLVLPYGVG